MDPLRLIPSSRTDLDALVIRRAGERKIGESVHPGVAGSRFTLLGIPEDIGVRSNGGRPGAAGGWHAFLGAFLNEQDNDFIDCRTIGCLGTVDTAGLGGDTTEALRRAVAELDDRVEPIVRSVVERGSVPIVVGGGHNNALPILRAVCHGRKIERAASLNIDSHLDFRAIEGRHSGNGFSYAHEEGILGAYVVFGAHEGALAAHRLVAFSDAGFSYASFESMCIRESESPSEALGRLIAQLSGTGLPVVLEVDLDAIADMPSSASSPMGWRVSEVAAFVHRAASRLSIAAFHLAEGAPSLAADGERRVGRALAALVRAFIGGSSR